MKKYLIFTIFSILLSLPVCADVFAASGFVPKQIWYSKENLVEGETVEVHTAIWNGESKSFLVKVEFYSGTTILGDREVTIGPSELKDVYVLWKVTAGEHVISAKIVSSEVVVSGKKENITLRYTKTSTDKQNVLAKEVEEKGTDEEYRVGDIVSVAPNILPANVDKTIAKSYNTVDNFRNETSVKLDKSKEEAKLEIAKIQKEDTSNRSGLDVKKSNTEDAIKKPLAYVKLFLTSILSFIFGHKVVFYGLLAVVIFYLFKIVFKAIRNR